ncbi:3238_t:CDS:2 [Ambispora gerdemannii]|uniref:3238_t:CDS:1 n=1 Tax=Ambispora gerdemannii TaxID=144530 RepID=A0A9N9EY35_9GLOM|nr:3238_t:CDS:2 [Ambispora gerdemannii]
MSWFQVQNTRSSVKLARVKARRFAKRLESEEKGAKKLPNNSEISSTHSKEFDLLKIIDVKQCIHPAIDVNNLQAPKIGNKSSRVLKINKASQINDITMLFAGLEFDRNLSKEAREVTDHFNDDSMMSAIHSEIIVEKAQIECDIEHLKPTAKLSQAIDEAIISNGNIELNDSTQKFEKFSELDFSSFQQSYWNDMNDNHIEISYIQQWLETVSNENLQSGMLSDVLLFHYISFLIAINESFFDEPLKSKNYQIYGNIITSDGEKLPEIVEFSLKSDFGFSVNWNEENEKKYNGPSEVGYFDAKTRDFSVKTGSTVLQLDSKSMVKTESYDTINLHYSFANTYVGAPLSEHNTISIDIKCPPFTKIVDYKMDGSELEIQITIEEDTSIELIKNNDQSVVDIRWWVLEELDKIK